MVNDWMRERLFYNDNSGIDKTVYLSIFGNLIKKMENLGFSVKPFELVNEVKNFRIDINKNLDSRNAWLSLDKELRGTGFSICSFKINPELLETSGRSIFRNLTPKFVDSLEKIEERPLLTSVHFCKGNNLFQDYWFDYTR